MTEDNAPNAPTAYPECKDCKNQIQVECEYHETIRHWWFFRKEVRTTYFETRCAMFFAYHPTNAREVVQVHFIKQEPGGLPQYELKRIPGPCGKEGKFFIPLLPPISP